MVAPAHSTRERERGFLGCEDSGNRVARVPT